MTDNDFIGTASYSPEDNKLPIYPHSRPNETGANQAVLLNFHGVPVPKTAQEIRPPIFCRRQNPGVPHLSPEFPNISLGSPGSDSRHSNRITGSLIQPRHRRHNTSTLPFSTTNGVHLIATLVHDGPKQSAST